MKTATKLLLALLTLLLAVGCRQTPSAGPPPSETQSLPSLEESSDSQALANLEPVIARLEPNLCTNWEEIPTVSEKPPGFAGSRIVDAVREEDTVVVEIEHYGNVFFDPDTMEDNLDYGLFLIQAKNSPYAPHLAVARSTLTLRETPDDYEAIACSYQLSLHPGLTYLKEETRRLAPQLEASELLDVSRYDERLVNYVWKVLMSTRLIESPREITLYDLEQYDGAIEIDYNVIDYGSMEDPAFALDASLLELMPNLSYALVVCRLTDYSVFQQMNNLEKLVLYSADDETFRTLTVGKTGELLLYDPVADVVDLQGVNAEALRLSSWSTAVGGFANCQHVKRLYIMSTRTDTALINAKNFPGVQYINNGRIRDFSNLSTFQGVPIDLYLDYQACRDETLNSLEGIALRDLYLHPENGSYPLEYHRALAENLNTKRVVFGPEMYFQERTG